MNNPKFTSDIEYWVSNQPEGSIEEADDSLAFKIMIETNWHVPWEYNPRRRILDHVINVVSRTINPTNNILLLI